MNNINNDTPVKSISAQSDLSRNTHKKHKRKVIPDKEKVNTLAFKKNPSLLYPPDYNPQKITSASLDTAYALLKKYKAGKANLEKRIIDNDLWWKMRHWEQIRDKNRKYNPASAWLFNAVANKHADVMDNVPEAVVLPREMSDTEAANRLTDILPVILEQNDFESLYSDIWYDKLKGGTGVYGIFWDPSMGNAGDIRITRCDILNLFWEAGVSDIQKSPHLFHAELFNNDELEASYPQLHGKLGKSHFDITEYSYDDAVDTSSKTPVIDWYYKTTVNGKQALHYCKFCADEVLYASENDLEYYKKGFYSHGQYPFVFDKLFLEQGSPCGFGFIDIMKDTQTQIDVIGASVCENVRMASSVRYFARGDGSINEREFTDWTNPIVHYTGSGNPNDSMLPIRVPELPSIYVSFLDHKISELKETSGNSEFTTGNTVSGVTAASAIAALQESGSKISRDMLKGSYRVYVKINNMIIELIRQFYDIPRVFRITGENGYDFISYSNESLLPQIMGNISGYDLGRRLPVFDIKVKAQKSTSFSKISQNELAKEFYKLGFFNPSSSEQTLACLDMMEFDGKNILLQKLNEKSAQVKNETEMYDTLLKLSSIVERDHPELTGIFEELSVKFAQKSTENPKIRLNSEQSAGQSQRFTAQGTTRVNNARDKASRAATPR